MKKITFSIYKFTQNELKQIYNLAVGYNKGDIYPIDRRKITKNVFCYALSRNIIKQGCDMQDWTGDFPWYVKEQEINRYYYDNERRFNPIYDIPIEVLWMIVEPMIDQRQGYSITMLPDWIKLGLWPNIGKQSNIDIDKMIEIFNRLSAHGYIYFQHFSDIWKITKRN
jgi:hypothetical protein